MKLYMSSVEDTDLNQLGGSILPESQRPAPQEKSFDERIRGIAPRKLTEREAIDLERKELECSARSLLPTQKISSVNASSKSRSSQPVDEKAVMRKAIGAMVYIIISKFNFLLYNFLKRRSLQIILWVDYPISSLFFIILRKIHFKVVLESIYESEHRMDAETIFKVGNDVGIDEHQVVNNTMLREIATTFNVDLDGYYERTYSNGGNAKSSATLYSRNSHVQDYGYYHEHYPTTSTNNLFNKYTSSIGDTHSPFKEKASSQNPLSQQLDLKALGIFLNNFLNKKNCFRFKFKRHYEHTNENRRGSQ